MALETMMVQEGQKFSDAGLLLDACKQEEQNISYIPVEEFNGEYFEDDYRLRHCSFNEDGMKSFLSRLNGGNGLFQTLLTIDRPGLASQVINDLMTTTEAQQNLGKTRFVVRTDSNTIIGAVGMRYEQVLNSKLVEEFVDQAGVEFDHGYLNNTRMVAKCFDKEFGMEMKSHGTLGKDFIKFGLMALNDMIGRNALSGSCFSERMLCTNQMTHPISGKEFRQIHVGNQLGDRFGEIIELCKGEYEIIRDRFQKLAEIEFKPTALASLGAPLDVLPEIRKERLYKPFHALDEEKRAVAIAQSSQVINEIPNKYGGSVTNAVWNSGYRNKKVMFDFCETFTEASQDEEKYSYEDKQEIEKASGNLVDWIVKNRASIENFRELPLAA